MNDIGKKINEIISDSRLWLINMYLNDKKKAREFIKQKLLDIKEQKNVDIELKDIKNLCRALKSSEEFPNYVTDHNIFIPAKGTLNRWNPPNRIFLYLACSLEDRLDRELNWNQTELTCINEVRAMKGENIKISISKFKYVQEYKNKKVFNLYIQDNYIDKIFDDKWDDIEKNFNQFDPKNANSKNLSILTSIPSIFEESLRKATERVAEYFFIDNIFKPIDENDNPEIEYKLFHILAEEVEKLGYIGILYPSTRMKRIGKWGTNLVLFDKEKYCIPDKEVNIKHNIY